ncbi:MAG: polymerase, sigma-24 subunit, subfamily [Mucilaginibacter sp.]|nr:polymerase, sigma-24 subunit, subfamily [Mucilaginibacter sp.]
MDAELYKIFLSSQAKLYRFAFSLVKNVNDAEDIHQETLMKIWQLREEWIKWINFEAYAMRIVRNACLNFNKKKRNHLYLVLDEVIEKPSQNDTETNIVLDDLKYRFNVLIGKLPEIQQNILYLREIEELEYKEIAEILDISESQVKVYLFRGRQFLKSKYQKNETR